MSGRFQVLNYERHTIVADTAHTGQALDMFIKTLCQSFPDGKFAFIVSLLKDKRILPIMHRVQTVYPEKVIYTRSSSPRAQDPEFLLNLHLEEGFESEAETASDISEALSMAELLDDSVIICVVGSTYLVGELLARIAAQHYQPDV